MVQVSCELSPRPRTLEVRAKILPQLTLNLKGSDSSSGAALPCVHSRTRLSCLLPLHSCQSLSTPDPSHQLALCPFLSLTLGNKYTIPVLFFLLGYDRILGKLERQLRIQVKTPVMLMGIFQSMVTVKIRNFHQTYRIGNFYLPETNSSSNTTFHMHSKGLMHNYFGLIQ